MARERAAAQPRWPPTRSARSVATHATAARAAALHRIPKWAARPQVALGYPMLAIVLLAFAVHKRNEPASAELDPEVPAEA